MSTFNITTHAGTFSKIIADPLKQGFLDIGLKEDHDNPDYHIAVGGCLFNKFDRPPKYNNCKNVLLFMENLPCLYSTPHKNQKLKQLIDSKEMWDYVIFSEPVDKDYFKRLDVDIPFDFGSTCYISAGEIKLRPKQDNNDLAFFGAISDRRVSIIDSIREKYKVLTPCAPQIKRKKTGPWPYTWYKYGTKYGLNIHFDKEPVNEFMRIIHLMANGFIVVTETLVAPEFYGFNSDNIIELKDLTELDLSCIDDDKLYAGMYKFLNDVCNPQTVANRVMELL